MSNMYKIVCDGLKVENVIAQLRAIKTFPAIITIYDRTMKIATLEECWSLCTGMEIGSFLTEDIHDREFKT